MDLLMVDVNVSNFFCFLLCINRSGLEFTVVLLLFPVSSRLFMSFDSVSDKPDRVLLFILFFWCFLEK